jgi:hypothetical protein
VALFGCTYPSAVSRELGGAADSVGASGMAAEGELLAARCMTDESHESE